MRPSYHFTAISFNDGYTVNCTAGHGTFYKTKSWYAEIKG